MKNKIIAIITLSLLVMFCVTHAGYSEPIDPDTTEISSEDVSISEAERIIDKYSSKISEGFSDVVEGITPYAENGFKYVVKLEITKGVSFLMPLLFSFLCLFLFYKIKSNYLKFIKENNPNEFEGFVRRNDFDDLPAMAQISTIAFWSFLVAGVICLPFALMRLVAPEWYAIQSIIELFS